MAKMSVMRAGTIEDDGRLTIRRSHTEVGDDGDDSNREAFSEDELDVSG